MDSYGKKPLWQWVVIYLIVGLVVYGAIYYFYFMKQGSGTSMYGTSTPSASATASVPANYLKDPQGMTLYIWDKDTQPNVSTCEGGCLQAWPAYLVGATAPSTLPAGFTTFKRSTGELQYAYNGHPLYYYANDTKPGDITGDGVGGTWHLVSL